MLCPNNKYFQILILICSIRVPRLNSPAFFEIREEGPPPIPLEQAASRSSLTPPPAIRDLGALESAPLTGEGLKDLKPKGILVAHLHEHKGPVVQVKVIDFFLISCFQIYFIFLFSLFFFFFSLLCFRFYVSLLCFACMFSLVCFRLYVFAFMFPLSFFVFAYLLLDFLLIRLCIIAFAFFTWIGNY
jgi:hypothetical protein